MTTTALRSGSPRRGRTIRALATLGALVLGFAVSSSTTGGGGQQGGWVPLPGVYSPTSLISSSAMGPVGTTGTTAVLVTQSLATDVKLSLPAALIGATAFIANPTGGTALLGTTEGRFVLSSGELQALAQAGVTRLQVVFVAPGGTRTVTIVIEPSNDTVTIIIG